LDTFPSGEKGRGRVEHEVLPENRGVYSLFAIARLASEAESRIKGSSKAQPEDDKELLDAQCRWLRSFALL
jgi:hypothetical protein